MNREPKLGRGGSLRTRRPLAVGFGLLLFALALPTLGAAQGAAPQSPQICPGCYHLQLICYHGAIDLNSVQLCHDQSIGYYIPPGSSPALATADSGYTFQYWSASGSCSIGSGNPTTFTMGSGSCVLTATFA